MVVPAKLKIPGNHETSDLGHSELARPNFEKILGPLKSMGLAYVGEKSQSYDNGGSEIYAAQCFNISINS